MLLTICIITYGSWVLVLSCFTDLVTKLPYNYKSSSVRMPVRLLATSRHKCLKKQCKFFGCYLFVFFFVDLWLFGFFALSIFHLSFSIQLRILHLTSNNNCDIRRKLISSYQITFVTFQNNRLFSSTMRVPKVTYIKAVLGSSRINEWARFLHFLTVLFIV